ncbi:MAG: NAD(P)H-dependent oxidoreductase [Steroidobacteraceae bacterium]
MAEEWIDLGPVETLRTQELQTVAVGASRVALSYRDGRFGAVSNTCNHVGGPLGDGRLDGEYLVCPWHYWKFHRSSGRGEPGYEADAVPSYALREENGHLLISAQPVSKRSRAPHPPHALARDVKREPGPVRVLGLSTTLMSAMEPRYSTSEALLRHALEHSAATAGCATQFIRVQDLNFRHCEGFYSKSARACTWPCSITQMDPDDQMDRIYEGVVHWADVILVATPIRWGAPSSLYQKMAERMNCIQNQQTIANRNLLGNKAVGFIITGGQDNVQAVAGQMLMFFAELGCQFPQYPFIAHSRGWSAEDMENNMREVRESDELRAAAAGLVERCRAMAELSIGGALGRSPRLPGGRKAHRDTGRARAPRA